ncbi:MAG: hypothetical protein CXT67_00205 [Methanobacteriota archaeon]|nr:MAG: hypothetical protein CXT67_00205 [Euryarchaeota archaeon]
MNEWKPDRKLKEWAMKHFAEMQIGGIWMPDGSGLTFVKVSENTWSLKSKVENAEAEDNLQRMKVLMFDVGFTLLEDTTQVLPEPTSAEEARMMEIHMKRDIAQNWAASDGTLLKDMGLEDIWPSYIEDREILLDNGDTTTLEVWAYVLTNPNNDEEISIDPDDYHLLMGDKYFMRFRLRSSKFNESEMNYEYHALSREEMIEYVDSNIGTDQGCAVGSTSIQGLGDKLHTNDGTIPVRIPPWMWGTYCMFTDRSEEE